MSPAARRAYEELKGAPLRRVNEAIKEIERDPAWRQGRFIAPAWSEHHGAIVDFTAQPYAITYEIRDGGAVVWILSIRAFLF